MKKNYLLLVLLTCFSIAANAITYTTVATGNWSSAASWDANGIPANPLPAGDVIKVNHLLTLTGSLTINGTLTWNTPSETVDLNQAIAGTGVVSVTGNIINAGVSITMTGSGSLSLTAIQSMTIGGYTTILSVVNGNMNITANGNMPGNYIGIDISNGATITTNGNGNIRITGKGGDSGDSNYGVYMVQQSKITGTGRGTVTVQGTGGASTDNNNHGVFLDGRQYGVMISSGGGTVRVTGTGGGIGTSNSRANFGIYISDYNSKITSGGNGAVNVTGTGGGGTSGYYNYGIYLNNTGQITAGGNGTVTVIGTGGATSGGGNIGILLDGTAAGSVINSGGGNVFVTATGGGTGDVGYNTGLIIEYNSIISSGGNGAVTVNGYGASPGGSLAGVNKGILIQSNSLITSGGSGSVTVQGTGGNVEGGFNIGIDIDGEYGIAQITSGGGPVSVTGAGGGVGPDGLNYGVRIYKSKITSGGNGNVSVNGSGGNPDGSDGSNYGVYVNRGVISSSGSGTVTVIGKGGNMGNANNGGFNFGIYLFDSTTVTSGGTGAVSLQGTGGNGQQYGNSGIYSESSTITSGGGNVIVTGTGLGKGNYSYLNYGVSLGASKITAGNNGNVTVTGYGGNLGGGGYSSGNRGISLDGMGAEISASGTGSVNVTGTGGGGNGTSENYGISLDFSARIYTTGSGTVTVNGTGGAATGTDNHGVVISNLSNITSTGGGTVNVVGNKGASSNAADIYLISNNAITTNSPFANINLTCTSGGLWPNASDTDICTGATKTITFTTGSKVTFTINGAVAGSQYQQLKIAGLINLNSASLVFAGGFNTTVAGDTFMIIDNDGTDAITGTFNGLPEGSYINNFMGSPYCARISYVGGTGNDVVLTVYPTFTYTITTTGNSIVVTDIAGNSETLTVSHNSPNIRFAVSGRYYIVNNGLVKDFNTTPADISLAGVNSITINTAGGNDIVDIGAFTANVLPSLTINGGTGNDVVNFNGDITFINNANLDLDMQNDDPAPGIDAISLANGTDLLLQGAGTATLKVSKNVLFGTNATFRTANGNFTIEANQQAAPTSASFTGITLAGGAIAEVTGTGILSMKATGGTAGGNGISLSTSAQIKGGSTGNNIVTGVGGAVASSNIYGVAMNAATSTITTNGGNIIVTGTGGGTGFSNGNQGIFLGSSAIITAGGSGNVTVNGTGGNSTGTGNIGVNCFGTSKITSNAGNINITGIGTGTGSGGNGGWGVSVANNAQIIAGGAGAVTITGTGPAGTSTCYGVRLASVPASGNTITSSGGNVSITGNGGGSGTGTDNYGVMVSAGSSISAGGAGTVSVTGTGGNTTGNNNYGIVVTGTNSTITSNGGSVSVIGTGGGNTTSANNFGVNVPAGGKITAGAGGTITVNGTGGSSTGTNNHGVIIVNTNGITSSSGAINVTGTKGSNSLNAADIMISGGTITNTSTTTGIALTSSVGGTWPNTTTTDISTTATQRLQFGTGSKLNIDIDGTTVNTQYQQLNIVGQINLNNAGLTFAGSSYTPVLGNTFTIINNDGTDAITGTFNGLAQGATIGNFLGTTLGAQISYTGGTGNDVVLTVVNTTKWYLDADNDGRYSDTLFSATSPGSNWISTMPAGGGGDCNDNDNTKWLSAALFVDNDNDNYDNGTAIVCYGASVPVGYKVATLGNDCNDADNTKWRSATLYIDNDNDNYDNGTATVCYGASIPAGYKATTLGSDCNDNNAAIHPGATEICGDGLDNDCSGGDLPCGPNTWKGGSTVWSNAGNWTIGIPTSTTDAVIPTTPVSGNNFPVITAGAAVKNLTVESGATVTVSSTGALTINGALANAGAVTIQNGGNFLQNSGSSYTGAGTFTVEKLVANAANGYRDISSPVATTVADLADDFSVFGQNGVQCWYMYNPYPNVQTYDEALSIVNGNYYEGWKSHTATSNTLTPLQGVAIRTYKGAPFTLDFTGTPNNGAKVINITNTASATPSQDGWNFVGNPYPSNIDWVQVAAMNPDITGSYYIFGTTGEYTGNWGTCNASGVCTGSGTMAGITRYISSGQGFFVKKTTPGTGIFSINNAARTATATNFYKTDAQENELRLTLSDNHNSDEILAYTDAAATSGNDIGLDAEKMAAGSTVYISFKMPDAEYAINVLDNLTAQTELPLIVWASDTGSYTFALTEQNLTGLTPYLKDNLTGTETNLLLNAPVLTLNGKQTYNQYSVVFKTSVTTGIEEQEQPVRIYSNGNRVFISRANSNKATVTISNLLGQQVTETTTSSELTTIQLGGTEAWYALVKVKEGDKVSVAKVLISNK